MLKKTFNFLIIIFFLFFLEACNGERDNKLDKKRENIKNSKEIYVPPLPIQWETSEGIKVIYYEDKEIPLIRGSFYIKGSVDDTENPLALEAMGRLLKLGGAKNFSASNIDKNLEKLSASISSSWGNEYGNVSFKALSQDIEEVFKMLSDIILNPIFEQKEVDLWKLKKRDILVRQKDYPESIASNKLKNILYNTSNYGYVAKEEDVKNITREMLLKEKKHFVIPNNSYLTIVGPISRKKINYLISKYFGNWERVNFNKKQIKDDKRYLYSPNGKEIYFMKKDDLTQASVYIVSKGPKIDEKDLVKYAIFSDYFGTGGFSSMLFNKLRVDKGLVYTTYGGVFPNNPYGNSSIFLETSNEKVINALKLVEKVVNDVKDKKNIDESILKQVKTAKINTQVFKTSSFDELIYREFSLNFLGFSKNYNELYESRIKAVTSEDIVNISKQYLNLEKSFVIIVASKDVLNKLKILMQDNESIFSKFNLNLCDIEKGLCSLTK